MAAAQLIASLGALCGFLWALQRMVRGGPDSRDDPGRMSAAWVAEHRAQRICTPDWWADDMEMRITGADEPYAYGYLKQDGSWAHTLVKPRGKR